LRVLPRFGKPSIPGVALPCATTWHRRDSGIRHRRAFMKQPDAIQKMAGLGTIAAAKEPDEFANIFRRKPARWKTVIDTAAIKID